MPDTIPEPEGEPVADRYAIPEPVVDRYAIPEPDEIVPTYVRNEAPWVGIREEVLNPGLGGPSEAPAVPGDEPEFTRLVRPRQRWRDAVAWATTAVLIVAAAWFVPILIVPTPPLGRVGSFATLAVGGLAVVAVLVKTWRWAHRAS
jgi:hypothetical protein